MTTTELEPLLTAGELAAILGITERAVYDMRYRGEGVRPTKIGSRLRFARSDVASYLKQQRIA